MGYGKTQSIFSEPFDNHLVINIFLWALWYFGGAKEYSDNFPWPSWTTLGWGVGLAIHFLGAYVFPKSNLVEREYKKLKRQQAN